MYGFIQLLRIYTLDFGKINVREESRRGVFMVLFNSSELPHFILIKYVNVRGEGVKMEFFDGFI